MTKDFKKDVLEALRCLSGPAEQWKPNEFSIFVDDLLDVPASGASDNYVVAALLHIALIFVTGRTPTVREAGLIRQLTNIIRILVKEDSDE